MGKRSPWAVYREAFRVGQVWAIWLPVGLLFLIGLLVIGFKNGWT